MPLTLTDRNLFLLDFCSLVTKANQDRTKQTSVSPEKHAVLTAQHYECSSVDRNDSCCEKPTSHPAAPRAVPSTQVCTEPVTRSNVPSIDSSLGSSDSDSTDLREVPRHGPDSGGKTSPFDSRRQFEPSSDQAAKEEYMHMTMEQLGHQQITFGKEKEGDALQRSCPGRPSLRGMVRFDIPEIRQASASEVHQVCQTVTRRSSNDRASRQRGRTLQPRERCPSRKAAPRPSALPDPQEKKTPLFVALHDSKERSLGTAARGDRPSERSDHSDRGSTDADRDSAPIPDRADEQRGNSSVEPEPSELARTLPIDRLQLCDALGLSVGLGRESHSSIDAGYLWDVLLNQETPSNSILTEMHQYWGNKYGVHELGQQKKHLQKPGIDLLEVYCSSDSALTNSANKSGISCLSIRLEPRRFIDLRRTLCTVR